NPSLCGQSGLDHTSTGASEAGDLAPAAVAVLGLRAVPLAGRTERVPAPVELARWFEELRHAFKVMASRYGVKMEDCRRNSYRRLCPDQPENFLRAPASGHLAVAFLDLDADGAATSRLSRHER